MKFGFTNERATSSTSSSTTSRSTRQPRKRSPVEGAEAAQSVSLTKDPQSSASAPQSSNSPTGKFDVYNVSWKHLIIDSAILRDMAESAFGYAMDSDFDDPVSTLRSLFELCSEHELLYVTATFGMEAIRNDKEALIDEIIKTMSAKKQLSFGCTQPQSGSIVSVSPRVKVEKCEVKSADRQMAAPQAHSRTTHSSGDVPSTPTKSDGVFVNNKASDGYEPFYHDELTSGQWLRKTLVRKSGPNIGKEYYKFVAPTGRIFSSLKAAKEFDASNKNESSGTLASAGDLPKEEEPHSPSQSLTDQAKDVIKSIAMVVQPPIYNEVVLVSVDLDNIACDDLVKEHGLSLITTAGTNYETNPGDETIDLRNTTSIPYMTSCILNDSKKASWHGTEALFVDFIQTLLDHVDDDHDYFSQVTPVLRQFLLESSNSYKRELHTIQWYYTLFDSFSRIFGVDIGLILPPDGLKDCEVSRLVRFPFGVESSDAFSPDIVYRLLLDRTKNENRLGDGGCIVSGVSVFVLRNREESSEVASPAGGDIRSRSGCDDSDEKLDYKLEIFFPDTKRLKSDFGNGRGPSLFDRVANGKSSFGDQPHSSKEALPNEIDISDTKMSARSLFTTPNNRQSAKSSKEDSDMIEKLQAEIEMLKEKNNATQSTTTVLISKGELQKNQGDQTSEGDEVSSGVVSRGGWGGLVSGGKAAILKVASPVKKRKSSRVALQVSPPIFNRKTGGQSCFIIFMEMGVDAWWLKSETMSCVCETFFKHVHKQNEVASCYVFNETTIKALVFGGDNNIAKKTRKSGATYPIYKMCCIMNFPGKGFPVETHLTKFESNIKSMFSDATVPAVIALDAMKVSSSNLYNGFFNGEYRQGSMKTVTYKDDDELCKDIKAALEATFKNGFGTKTLNQPLNKHLTDWGIKQYLTEIGYTSFDDVKDCDRNSIYRGRDFPIWSAIEEDIVN